MNQPQGSSIFFRKLVMTFLLLFFLTVGAQAQKHCNCSFKADNSPLSLRNHQEFCSLPPVTELRRIETTYLSSPTHVSQNYNISQTPDGYIHIGINPIFTDGEEGLRVLSNCLEEANLRISPKNGPRIQIDVDPTAPPFQIKENYGSPARTVSSKWNYHDSCPTRIHEVFHLLGLVDEYKEKEYGPYPCRKIGRETSLMNDQDLAYASAFSKLRVLTCHCKDEEGAYVGTKYSKLCNKVAQKLIKSGVAEIKDIFLVRLDKFKIPKECPMKVEEKKHSDYQFSAGDTLNSFYGDGQSNVISLGYGPTPDSPGMLSPTQANVILYPGCTEKNQKYYDCANDAYNKDPGSCKKCDLSDEFPNAL